MYNFTTKICTNYCTDGYVFLYIVLYMRLYIRIVHHCRFCTSGHIITDRRRRYFSFVSMVSTIIYIFITTTHATVAFTVISKWQPWGCWYFGLVGLVQTVSMTLCELYPVSCRVAPRELSRVVDPAGKCRWELYPPSCTPTPELPPGELYSDPGELTPRAMLVSEGYNSPRYNLWGLQGCSNYLVDMFSGSSAVAHTDTNYLFIRDLRHF